MRVEQKLRTNFQYLTFLGIEAFTVNIPVLQNAAPRNSSAAISRYSNTGSTIYNSTKLTAKRC